MDLKLDFDDVLIKPTRTTIESRADVNLEVKLTGLKHATLEWSGVPICAPNNSHVGVFPVARMLTGMRMLTMIRAEEPMADWIQACKSMDVNYLCPTVGIEDNAKAVDTLRQVMAIHKDLKFICIDAANGNQLKATNTVKKVRSAFPNKIIIAGRVNTPDGACALVDAGADVIRVGMPLQALSGVGYPAFSALQECVVAVGAWGGRVMVETNNVATAFAAGADFVVAQNWFDGCEECDGVVYERVFKTDEVINDKDVLLVKKYVSHYSSAESFDVPFRGSVTQAAQKIQESVVDACIMTNSRSLQKLRSNAQFVRTTSKMKIDLTNNQFERKITSVGVDVIDKCIHQFPVQYSKEKDETQST